MSRPWTLSDVQRLQEEIRMSARLNAVAHEHRARQLLGDDVYEFVCDGAAEIDGVVPVCADGIVDHADEVVQVTESGVTVVECGWCGRRTIAP